MWCFYARLGQVGDRVAVPFILSCGNCRQCARNRPTICETQGQPGFTMPGGFAEFVAVPRADRNVCLMPPKADGRGDWKRTWHEQELIIYKVLIYNDRIYYKGFG